MKVDYLTASVIDRSRAMQEWISAHSQLPASAYWDILNEDNLASIAGSGVLNFKRTVSQNYFNFIIANTQEGQFKAALHAWATAPDDIPLLAELRGNVVLDVRGNAVVPAPFQERVYTFFVGLLWSLASKGAKVELAAKLSEPELGSPVEIRLPDNRLISQDLANSLREWQRFESFLVQDHFRTPILAEIGAGYGRLGWLALQACECKYWVFDIPPALGISEFYLTHTYPDKKIFRWRPFTNWSDVADEVNAADLAFFTSDQLRLVPDRSVSAFAAVSCLHEMKPEQFMLAMSLMCSKTSLAIYTKNWTAYTVPADNYAFSSEMIRPDRGWATAFSRPDDVLLDMTEKLFVRSE